MTQVLRVQAISKIEEANQSGCRIAKACESIGIDVRTFERWRLNPNGDMRKGPLTKPANKLSDLERQEIINTVTSKEYVDKSPSQIVPLLADKGVYLASEASFYRILKEEKMDAHRSKSTPIKKKKPMELVADGPNQVYSWDITYLQSTIKGMFFYLYFFMDVYSRKIVGYTVQKEQSALIAAEMMEVICKRERIQPWQITLHSDNGSPMKGATMLAKLQILGVMPSFSRPSVSNDNPYSESLFKTTKYCPKFPSNPFETVESASEWVEEFVHWYNEEHLHSGISFVTPGSRHRGEDIKILEDRQKVYEEAQLKSPTRWSGVIRNWGHVKKVFLNPLQGKESSSKKNVA